MLVSDMKKDMESALKDLFGDDIVIIFPSKTLPKSNHKVKCMFSTTDSKKKSFTLEAKNYHDIINLLTAITCKIGEFFEKTRKIENAI